MLSSVLLMSLLIAMMGKTFEENDQDTDRIWIFPFAALVLKYERLLSTKEVRRLLSLRIAHGHALGHRRVIVT